MNIISKLILICFLLLFGRDRMLGQSDVITPSNKTNSPLETIYIDYNNSFLLTGEYLYYSVYCLDRRSKTFSKYSTIAYVKLIGSTGKVIFHHKLNLDNGRAQGDFFIPTTIPSGNYKLLGYTRLMRNGKQSNYFQADLTIINPYTNDQKILLKETKDSINSKHSVKRKLDVSDNQKEVTSINMSINKFNFKKREKVQLTIQNQKPSIGNGSYSLSVRKLYKLKASDRPSAKEFADQYLHDNTATNEDYVVMILPEIRGELYSGKVVATDPKMGVANVRIAISVPGKNYIFKVVTTNIKGQFYFTLNESYEGDEAVLQLLEDNDKYTMLMDSPKPLDVSKISFNKFRLEEEIKPVLLERSIHNQIENNYFSFMPDSIKVPAKRSSFYGFTGKEYDLDDYTRFSTVRETIVEILQGVWIKKTGNSEERIQIRSNDPDKELSGFEPLIIIDGFRVKKHDELLKMDAGRIAKIQVIRDKYILGPQVFQGVLDIVTFEGKLWKNLTEGETLRHKLFKPLPKKFYFKRKYDLESLDTTVRIPDFRHQIYWNPLVQVQEESLELEFYTSDVSGDFEIRLEGFTNSGEPVSILKSIRVN